MSTWGVPETGILQGKYKS